MGIKMQWGKQQKLASRAIAEGDLRRAAELLQQDRYRNTLMGRRVARRLTSALVEHAENCTYNGNLHQAWDDLTIATKVAVSKDADLISKKKNRLVELTVETAESYLTSGKVAYALQAIEELSSRKIMDWRADRIGQTAKLIKDAEESAAEGNLDCAVQQLEQAKNLRPELDFIAPRLAANRQRRMQLRDLTSELRQKTIKGDWGAVNACCQKLLEIAPKYKVAMDAQKHCLCQMKRKTFAGMRATHVPAKDDSFFKIGSPSELPDVIEFAAPDKSVENAFLLWVDGVGGFLVCTEPKNVIGQALPNADISIPILGDLRRRHARIETVDDRHLLQFLDTNQKEGSVVEQPLALRTGQKIELDGGVKLQYTQSHPLSSTARVDFVSRHRTQPWSDAVLLAGPSIILGPNPNNHIYAPEWKNDLILFRRGDEWICRSKTGVTIDGVEYDSEGPVKLDSCISGDDFSMSLESAFGTLGNSKNES